METPFLNNPITLKTQREIGFSIPTVSEILAKWEEERGLTGPEKRAVYVSMPISTGKLFIEWYRDRGAQLRPGSREYEESLRSNVILPNSQRAGRYVELIRWSHVGLVIDPRTLDVPGWEQEHYHHFWSLVMERQARRVIFLDGWELSRGCTIEFEHAKGCGIDCVDAELAPLTIEKGMDLISHGISEARDAGLGHAWIDAQTECLTRLRKRAESIETAPRRLFKDEILDHLAVTANVAQFVSFDLSLEQRYSRILGFEPNHRFPNPSQAISSLLERSPEGKVNIRSFDPERPEDNPFIKGLVATETVLAHLRKLAEEKGLYTIVNEVIDEHDGGVSGVSYRNLLEFAPDATPRVVDDPDADTAILPFELGMRLLEKVYGFEPDLRAREGARVEFSIHPQPRGWNHGHTIIWQSVQRPASALEQPIVWPNAFTRMIGDKAFGLAVAAVAGLTVPRTIVFTRRLFPFSIGRSTGSMKMRTRTAPAEKIPGYYPSAGGWHDPFQVLQNPWMLDSRSFDPNEDFRDHLGLSSVLIQEHVEARYSGRLVPTRDSLFIEGVAGGGEHFMLGEEGSASLPNNIQTKVADQYRFARSKLGPVSFEWVFDGSTVWIVQINPHDFHVAHQEASPEWVEFRYTKGRLEDFRRLVKELAGTGKGIAVFGNVSPLSHVGEIADQHNVPARFERVVSARVET